MRVDVILEKRGTCFGDVSIGETFIADGQLWMKMEPKGSESLNRSNAVRLMDGHTNYWFDHAGVTLFPVRVVAC